MSFMEKARRAIAQFMYGRNGLDYLSMAMVIASLVFSILTSLTGFALLNLISIALYILAFYRIFSKNLDKRRMENARYCAMGSKLITECKQAKVRFSNRKIYKYFRCPKCHQMLRMKRGAGKKNIHCAKCGHDFEQHS